MNKTELEKGWLVENAVLALVGALLLAQTLKPPYELYELPFNLTLPVSYLVAAIIASILFLASFLLALVVHQACIDG